MSLLDGLLAGNAGDLGRILGEHQRLCEAKGDYGEAELARRRLDRMKQQARAKELEALALQQQSEAHNLQRGMHQQVHDSVSDDSKFGRDGLDNMIRQLKTQLAERQSMELQQFASRVVAEKYSVKWPPQVLDMMWRADCLGKQGRYKEAREMQRKVEEAKAAEENRRRQAEAAQMSRRKRNFEERQRSEAAALDMRIQGLLAECSREQQRNQAVLQKRWQNASQNLHFAHAVSVRNVAGGPIQK
mmetsp:Transcript_17140/g.43595  ORF Transcript_17140/g.43595 Transcript_17140/m.43595 type:complete len:245 (-) Transcript_17140:26-760(-)